MTALPRSTVRLQDQSGTAPVATDLLAIIAPCVSNADGVPRLYSAIQAALDTHGYCEGLEAGATHLEVTGKPFLFVGVPIVTAGSIRRQKSMHTGTSSVVASAASGGILAEVNAILTVTNGGTIGTSQILLSLSLDNGRTYKPIRLGTATSFTMPYVGIVVTFLSGGTLVAGDTILEVDTNAPKFDATGVATAKAGLKAKKWVTRSWLCVSDLSTLALAQAIETQVNSYETADDRFTEALCSVRDWRRLKSSQQRLAMTGAPSITFAEVGVTGDTITRATGSFVTDGFTAGDCISVTGGVVNSGHNNVTGKITGVTATVLTLDTADLDAETLASGVAITAEPGLTFATTTITRNRGDWVAEGFAVGDVITITGGANDGVTATITTISSTVITCSAATFTTGFEGSCTTTVSLTETDAACIAAVDSTFAAVATSQRVSMGYGRLKRTSPITGYNMRRPVAWADTARSYQHDIRTTSWWKALGALDGWSIEDEHDERVTNGALDARFTCARTYSNDDGAFIAKAVTRAADGSALALTHNMFVANLVQTVVQRETEKFIGETELLKDDGTLRPEAIADLQARVNRELQRNVLSNIGGEGPRASACNWLASTTDVLTGSNATLNGAATLNFNGTLVNINTKVKVK